MAKKLIRLFVILSSFFLSAVLTGSFLNHDNMDMTAETPPAAFPVVRMVCSGEELSPIFGRNDTAEQDLGRISPKMAVFSTDRVVNFVVDRFGQRIVTVEFELRSRDGSRLIEKGEVIDTREEEGRLHGSVALKDLIEADQEYCFTILLNPSGRSAIRYTTPVLFSDGLRVYEKCEFVKNFHEATLDRERFHEVSGYLEPDSTGDNSSYAKVNIHSSLTQVSWGDLAPAVISPTSLTLWEISKDGATISLDYRVGIQIDGEESQYNVREDFRIRDTAERFYLLDYERTMHRIFIPEQKVYGERTLTFGITEKDAVQLTESDDGNILAFVCEDRRFVLNQVTGRIAQLYGAYDQTHNDIRYIHNDHGIKVLTLEETGNCVFLVHGYINRGLHEGEVGMLIWYYDSGMNTIEEQLFIPYKGSPGELSLNLERLLHLSRGRELVFWLDGNVYRVNIDTGSSQTYDFRGELSIAGDQDYIVSSVGDPDSAQTLLITDLTDFTETRIYADPGNYIKPLGFMGGDFIYGLAKMEDVRNSYGGASVFPMHTLRIQTPQGTVLSNYEKPGIYVTGIRIEENQIILERVTMDENGSLMEETEDQITNAALAQSKANRLETVPTLEYETIVQVVLKTGIKAEQILAMIPREVLFEGERLCRLEQTAEEEAYYVYALGGLSGIYGQETDAFQKAYETSGFALTGNGEYIYRRTVLAVKNQIMAIRETESADSVRECLKTVLSFEGGRLAVLDTAIVPSQALKDGLPEARVLDLTGCPLSGMEFFLNQDIPVMAFVGGEAVLLTGFNETEYVVMDPLAGTLEKHKKTELAQLFGAYGNRFLTYIRT